MSVTKFIYFDNEKGNEKEAKSSMIDEYLKAVDTFKDIISDKINEYDDKYNNRGKEYDSDGNGYLEITDN